MLKDVWAEGSSQTRNSVNSRMATHVADFPPDYLLILRTNRSFQKKKVPLHFRYLFSGKFVASNVQYNSSFTQIDVTLMPQKSGWCWIFWWDVCREKTWKSCIGWEVKTVGDFSPWWLSSWGSPRTQPSFGQLKRQVTVFGLNINLEPSLAKRRLGQLNSSSDNRF